MTTKPPNEVFDAIQFRVDGLPRPKGSKSSYVSRSGRSIMFEQSEATKRPWWDSVTAAAIHAQRERGDIRFPLLGQVAISIGFFFPRPKLHYLPANSRRTEPELRPGSPFFCSGKPDPDKLERAVLDAITDSQLWRDDAQVVAMSCFKLYASDMHRPGAVISIQCMERFIADFLGMDGEDMLHTEHPRPADGRFPFDG